MRRRTVTGRSRRRRKRRRSRRRGRRSSSSCSISGSSSEDEEEGEEEEEEEEEGQQRQQQQQEKLPKDKLARGPRGNNFEGPRREYRKQRQLRWPTLEALRRGPRSGARRIGDGCSDGPG
eukprot:2583067-Pyramimonas_sp.AAC.1